MKICPLKIKSYFKFSSYTYTAHYIDVNVCIFFGTSGVSLVATPDCKPAVLGSNLDISPAYSGFPVLSWAAIWDSI